jgi:hypothetical protein
MITLPANAISDILNVVNGIITDIMPFAVLIFGAVMGIFLITGLVEGFRDGSIKWKP